MQDKLNTSQKIKIRNYICGILTVIPFLLLVILLCTDFFRGENALLILPFGIFFLITLFLDIIIYLVLSIK